MTLHFTFPLPPDRGNARGHWRVHHRERKRYIEALDNLQLLRKVPGPPARPFGSATLTAKLYLWNPMDPDNATARLKWAIDWLVTRGYVAGDSPRNLSVPQPEQEIDRSEGGQRLELTLEAVT